MRKAARTVDDGDDVDRGGLNHVVDAIGLHDQLERAMGSGTIEEGGLLEILSNDPRATHKVFDALSDSINTPE